MIVIVNVLPRLHSHHPYIAGYLHIVLIVSTRYLDIVLIVSVSVLFGLNFHRLYISRYLARPIVVIVSAQYLDIVLIVSESSLFRLNFHHLYISGYLDIIVIVSLTLLVLRYLIVSVSVFIPPQLPPEVHCKVLQYCCDC